MDWITNYLLYLAMALVIIFGLAHGIARLIKGNDFYWVPLLISSIVLGACFYWQDIL